MLCYDLFWNGIFQQHISGKVCLRGLEYGKKMKSYSAVYIHLRSFLVDFHGAYQTKNKCSIRIPRPFRTLNAVRCQLHGVAYKNNFMLFSIEHMSGNKIHGNKRHTALCQSTHKP